MKNKLIKTNIIIKKYKYNLYLLNYHFIILILFNFNQMYKDVFGLILIFLWKILFRHVNFIS